MKQRSTYEVPRVLGQAECLLESDLLVDSRDLSMWFESMDINVQEYSFTDVVDATGENVFNPFWE
jgi:hypothetical protein